MSGRQAAAVSYHQVVAEVLRQVEQVTPEGAVVAVVSRGDGALTRLDGRQAWHFPCAVNGNYAGHYPSDDAAAIRHLDTLRQRGAQFLVLPAPSLWWLDHYQGFRSYLEQTARLLVGDVLTCFIYDLPQGGADERDDGAVEFLSPAEPPRALSWEPYLDDLRSLMDLEHYSRCLGADFETREAAVAHYVASGPRSPDPNPLFDSSWYLSSSLSGREVDCDPLLHFLAVGERGSLDPSPYFDTAYYHSQCPSLRKEGGNALVHYVRSSNGGSPYEPNPLFDTAYYIARYPAARRSGRSALADYVMAGAKERRLVSRAHGAVLDHLRHAGRSNLFRGNWKELAVLFVTDGGRDALLHEAAEVLARHHHVDALVLSVDSPGAVRNETTYRKALALQSFELAFDLRRLSALRVLLLSLAETRPALAVTSMPEIAPILAAASVPVHVITSGWQAETVKALLQELDAIVPLRHRRPSTSSRSRATTRKILIPCSDWGLSGVNTALEAVAVDLIARGWDVELLFSSDERRVTESMGASRPPSIPSAFLGTRDSGVEGIWEALVARLQSEAPCVVLLAYDFLGNSVVPALTDDVAVVMCVQADDADYYEQAYRLGRYANAIVAVSGGIKRKIVELNPGLATRLHVIHNSSVRAADISSPRRSRGALSIAYAGRLVQYQKRVLDFVELAQALDRVGCEYTITLIGAFGEGDIEDRFRADAAEHLCDGRIVLRRRAARHQVLAELRQNAFFALLSDFEGFPVSAVEAMAQGCVPVVAEMESGAGELIDNGVNGLLVAGRDYGRWAKKILSVWSDEERYLRMSRAAQAVIRERFTVEHIATEFDALFSSVTREVAAGGFRRPPALHWGEECAQFGDVMPPPVSLGTSRGGA